MAELKPTGILRIIWGAPGTNNWLPVPVHHTQASELLQRFYDKAFSPGERLALNGAAWSMDGVVGLYYQDYATEPTPQDRAAKAMEKLAEDACGGDNWKGD